MVQPWHFEACSLSAFFTDMYTPLTNGNDGCKFSQVAVWVQFSRPYKSLVPGHLCVGSDYKTTCLSSGPGGLSIICKGVSVSE